MTNQDKCSVIKGLLSKEIEKQLDNGWYKEAAELAEILQRVTVHSFIQTELTSKVLEKMWEILLSMEGAYLGNMDALGWLSKTLQRVQAV